MKIAVSSEGKDLNSDVSEVFGRCPYFIIAEIENKKIQKFETIKNESADQRGGAGISAARKIAEKGANAVITRNTGPRALDVLKQFGIKSYNGCGTVKDVLQKFIENELREIQ